TIARGVGSGARYVCDLVGLDDALAGAALVVTGEGSLDEQTLRGKAPAEVVARAAAAGVPCLGLAGVVRLTPERLRAAGFVAGHGLTEVEPDLGRCVAEAPRVLAELAARVVGTHLPPGAPR
ncbi:glycerate kinase, partial [Blastococcus sp. KM273129]|uniref:glycerate kinase n=3 Tax=unclassified Blastococcus TaxID=2619396 RepID=UPI001F2C4277